MFKKYYFYNFILGTVFVAIFSTSVFAEKVLIYDEERGIIFVDSDSLNQQKKKSVEKIKSKKISTKKVLETTSKTDIHVGRKKDPPELYFKSGLEYFKSHDYYNALKNFQFAYKLDKKKVEYKLWIGKAYRGLEEYPKMLEVMNSILKRFPDSDVADDALFEIAFYYHKIGDYATAIEKYKQLAEIYPFGLSYSNGESFREVSRMQRQTMRAEIISKLNFLGYKGDMLEDLVMKFQKANDLKMDGRLSIETSNMIKDLYKQKLAQETKKNTINNTIKKLIKWEFLLIIISIINLIFIVSIRNVIKQKHQYVLDMESTLNDLNVRG